MGNREKLLEAATAILGRNGYQATSVDEILEAARVAPSNFYYHFKSKEELAIEVLEGYFEKSRQEIIDLALSELGEFFPESRHAKLVKSTVIKEVHATYSPKPGIDAYRPRPETVWPRVFLAGDWTATGWPATMEGAVRSGYAAAQCVARVAGQRKAAFLVPDLPAKGFMRIFG